jgi:hypothetical protein
VGFGAEVLAEDGNEDTNSEIETLGKTGGNKIAYDKTLAVRFIHQIHTAMPTTCQLLASTTKSDVIKASML